MLDQKFLATPTPAFGNFPVATAVSISERHLQSWTRILNENCCKCWLQNLEPCWLQFQLLKFCWLGHKKMSESFSTYQMVIVKKSQELTHREDILTLDNTGKKRGQKRVSKTRDIQATYKLNSTVIQISYYYTMHISGLVHASFSR